VVLGLSFDTPAENRAFAQAQGFPFLLLSADRGTGEAYGVARPEQERYAGFARRYSYLIGPDGLIRRSYDVTDLAAHGGEVVADIDHLVASDQASQ
jgi:thioredoxin-dependent peroxiredoxin